MAEFNDDDDDFSDLYADVELQASSAIRALNEFSKMPLGYGTVQGGGGGITKLPSEKNGDVLCESVNGDDGNNQKIGASYGSGEEYEDQKRNIQYGKKCEGSDGNAYGGDYDSRRKSLKHDSLNCKKRGGDATVEKVHKLRENSDADISDDRDICYSRDSKDSKPNVGRFDGGGKFASERNSRHTHASDLVPSDLEKYGSVQISDSVEANDHEGSESDSGGMPEVMGTSGGTNRRNEFDSSQSGWSQHGSGSFCSPSTSGALSDRDSEKSRKNSISPSSSSDRELQGAVSRYRPSKDSKSRDIRRFRSTSGEVSDTDSEKSRKNSIIPSSSSDRELQGAVSREYRPYKDSKSRDIRPSSRDGRYCERQRGHTRNEMYHHKRSTDMPDLKTHRTDDIAYVIDNKRIYNRHGNHRGNLNLNTYRESKVHFNQSENLWSRSGRYSPDLHRSFRYKADWRRVKSVNTIERQWEKRSNKMDYETSEDDWYHNQRRHKLTRRCSSGIDRRGTSFSIEGDGMRFQRNSQVDYFPPVYDYNNNFIKGKNTRFVPGDRDRDHLEHIHGQNITCDRRELEISERGKRRYDSSHNSLDNLWNIETEDNDRRYIKHQPQPCAPGSGQFQGAGGPKSGVPGRNTRFLWKDMHIESVRYGTNFATCEGLRFSHSENHQVRRRHNQQFTNTHLTNGNIKDHYNQDRSARIRYHKQPEVSHLREEAYTRQRHDTLLHSEGRSYQFERTFSRNNRHGGKHAVGRVAEPIDEREVDGHRIRIIREEDHSNQFDGCRKFIQPDSRVPRNRDIVQPHLVVVGKKCSLLSSKRTSEAGDDIRHARDDLMEWNDNQKPKNFEELGVLNRERAVLTNEGKVDKQLDDKKWHDEFLDVEEGQIVSEEIDAEPLKHVIASEDIQLNDMAHPENASVGTGVFENFSDQKIQEIMAKMERRRERFKEPIFSNGDSAKTSNHLPSFDVESAAGKLEKPARKRRWLGI